MQTSINDMTPEQLITYRQKLNNCIGEEPIKGVVEAISETRDKLFSELFEVKLPGNTDSERINFFYETRGYVRGLSLLESTLRGEIVSVEELYNRIKAQMKETQPAPNVAAGDFTTGGYTADETNI